jgi:uncharacterized membrane protein YdjX (TVP38/TMEM64 family)
MTDRRFAWWRLAALGGLGIGLIAVGKLSGVADRLSLTRIHGHVLAAGAWGPILFVALFTLGELVHVPGMVFVAAAVLAYGRAAGGGLALAGALVSLSVSFAVVRAVGGKPFAAVRWSLVAKLLASLDARPVRTIVLLRLLLWMAPQLNYALALSRVRFSHYFIGSAIGLVLPITVISFGLGMFGGP